MYIRRVYILLFLNLLNVTRKALALTILTTKFELEFLCLEGKYFGMIFDLHKISKFSFSNLFI